MPTSAMIQNRTTRRRCRTHQVARDFMGSDSCSAVGAMSGSPAAARGKAAAAPEHPGGPSDGSPAHSPS